MANFQIACTKEQVVLKDFPRGIVFSERQKQISPSSSCESNCPILQNIKIISILAESHPGRAYRLLQRVNPIPCTCAYICDKCKKDKATESLESLYFKLFNKLSDGKFELEEAPQTGKKVAVVGSGPAGITIAYFLACIGHSVTIFERHKKLGGMLRYGIPSFRLPKEYLDFDISAILSLNNLRAKCDTNISSLDDLENLSKLYDVVYMSIGAQHGRILKIPGKDSAGVIAAVDMLRNVADGNPVNFQDKNVVVIGGGNVAMDAIRTSIRLGAKNVTCAYRSKTAKQSEYDAAIKEGCKFLSMVSPETIVSDRNNKVVGISLKKQQPLDSKESESLEIPADFVIMAVGQTVETEYFCNQDISFNECMVSLPDNIFAGGDCVTGPKTVFDAIDSSKDSLLKISKYLQS